MRDRQRVRGRGRRRVRGRVRGKGERCQNEYLRVRRAFLAPEASGPDHKHRPLVAAHEALALVGAH